MKVIRGMATPHQPWQAVLQWARKEGHGGMFDAAGKGRAGRPRPPKVGTWGRVGKAQPDWGKGKGSPKGKAHQSLLQVWARVGGRGVGRKGQARGWASTGRGSLRQEDRRQVQIPPVQEREGQAGRGNQP